MNEVYRFTAENLVNSLPLGAAIAFFAWSATRVLRSSGSRIRFFCWLAALSAIVVVPWASIVRDTSYRGLPVLPTGAWTLPEAAARFVVVAWIMGAAFGLAHVVLGLLRLRRMRTSCVPVALSEIDPRLRATLAEAQQTRKISFCVSDSVRVPAAVGYFRPAVIFPAWAFEEIAPDELNAILVHELAHLKRYDDWTNLAQKMARAVFFFHPAVWFIESRLTLEREMACDDAVLAANYSPRAYAESLVNLAEKSFLRRGLLLVQAAVSHVEQLKLRLAEILRGDRRTEGSAGFARPAVAVLALAGIVGGYGLAHFPRLVAFDADSNFANIAAVNTPAPVQGSVPGPVKAGFTDAPSRSVGTPKAKVAVQPVTAKASAPVVRRAVVPSISEDPQPPELVLTGARADLATMPVVLVFQAEQIGMDGPVLWRVTVFHLTSYQQQFFSGQIPKQI